MFQPKKACAVLLLLLMLPLAVLAHSGRTDGSGGHRDNKNKSGLGSYHYHCGGHPPHLHSGGKCPYSPSSKTKRESTPRPTATPAPTATPRPLPMTVASQEFDEALLAADLVNIPLPIQRGDVSAWVKDIQDRLIELRYLFDVADGMFGLKTQGAVEAFQRDREFEVDGIVEEEEYIALMYWLYE